MTSIDTFIYIWLSIAAIKTIILVGTGIKLSIEKNEDVIVNIFGSIFSALITGISVLFIWPILLFNQKSKFFSFPDLQYKKMIINEVFLRNSNKG